MEYRHYLPSKRFVFLLGSFLIAGLVIYGASLMGKGKTLTEVVSLSTVNTSANPNLVDGDGDNLPDWEEAVRGTDPHKADSDNDGTPDGEEVQLGRNPLKTGPDDSLVSAENDRFIAELTAAASSSNLTDTISRTLFTQYLSARGSGTSGDVGTQEKIVSDLIAKASVGLKGRTYTQNELTLSAESAEAMRTFANATIRAIHNHPTANFNLAMNHLTSAVDTGDIRAVAKLRVVGDEYRALARELSEIPTPPSLVELYIKEINALENAGASFEDISFILEDPVRAVAGLRNYNVLTNIITFTSVSIAQAIGEAGVRFQAGDAGAEWYQFFNQLTNPGN